jgi:hypothetical protein
MFYPGSESATLILVTQEIKKVQENNDVKPLLLVVWVKIGIHDEKTKTGTNPNEKTPTMKKKML